MMWCGPHVVHVLVLLCGCVCASVVRVCAAHVRASKCHATKDEGHSFFPPPRSFLSLHRKLYTILETHVCCEPNKATIGLRR